MSRSKLNSKLSLRSIFPLFLERLKPNTKSQCLYFIANLHRLKYIRNICIYIFQLYISFPKIVMNLIKQHHYSIQFKFPQKWKEFWLFDLFEKKDAFHHWISQFHLWINHYACYPLHEVYSSHMMHTWCVPRDEMKRAQISWGS